VDETRYARHIVLPEFGREGQQRLSEARVLLVGLGGLGCPAAQMLASSGIGTLHLNDFDTVDVSNLPRQFLFRLEDAGRPKVEVAASRLAAMNPEVSIEIHNRRLDKAALAALLPRVDIVLDGTDNFSTRFAVSDACVDAGKPLVSGAAIRLEGQVAVFMNDGKGPCYRCIYNDEDEFLGDCQGNGVLAPVTAVIGATMALEAIKVLAGLHSGPPILQLWDAGSGEWTRVAIRRNPNCAYCDN
jgi:adenylyltransferase/sulfurtransferase